MKTTDTTTSAGIQARLLGFLQAHGRVWHRDELVEHMAGEFDPDAIASAIDGLIDAGLAHRIGSALVQPSWKGLRSSISVTDGEVSFEQPGGGVGVETIESAPAEDLTGGAESLAPGEIGKAP